MTPLLEGRGLVKAFGALTVLNGVTLRLSDGETVGLVGESGCGKTTVSRILIGIEPPTRGEVRLDGAAVSDAAGWARLRRRVQYVFQDPFTSLCPTMRIGAALREPRDVHRIGTAAERGDRVEAALRRVGLPADTARRLPAQLSGGQRQRVSLARALMVEPQALICDEIVSGLDVSVQAQVLELLVELQRSLRLALIFISHDLRVVRYLCDRVMVMYLGEIVEEGPAEALFADPRHPYTQGLLAAVPDPGRGPSRPIPGEPTSARQRPAGCGFADRCPIRRPSCAVEPPPVVTIGARSVRCVAA